MIETGMIMDYPSYVGDRVWEIEKYHWTTKEIKGARTGILRAIPKPDVFYDYDFCQYELVEIVIADGQE